MSEDMDNNSVKSGGLKCLWTLLSSLSTFKIDLWPDSPSASQPESIGWLCWTWKKNNIALVELCKDGWKVKDKPPLLLWAFSGEKYATVVNIFVYLTSPQHYRLSRATFFMLQSVVTFYSSKGCQTDSSADNCRFSCLPVLHKHSTFCHSTYCF